MKPRISSSVVSRPRRWWRILLGLVGLLVGVVLVAVGLGVGALRASLAKLDGSERVSGLSARVTVERDALGVPTIRASNRLDAARALGFVHAQERFFQMDLLRRRSAGELAALMGPALVDVDVATRRHGLRAAARRVVEQADAVERGILEAYAAGVNEGVRALGARPPEYWLLREVPAPWKPEDSLLIGFSMFLTLQDDSGGDDLSTESLVRGLPRSAADFFASLGSEWEAPIDGTELPREPIPGPEVLDFRTEPRRQAKRVDSETESGTTDVFRTYAERRRTDSGLLPGSNSWGIHGEASATGAAIICDDMHLDLGVPNIWYRVVLEWTEASGGRRRLVGASLAGVPTLIVGSNGDIAWGFTNATIDNTDVVVIEVDPANPNRYRTPEGWKDFEIVTDRVEIHGAASREVQHRRTVWGPVITGPAAPRTLALLWTPHQPGGAGLGLVRLETAGSVDEALAVAPLCGVPVQNLLVGDRAGRLAYTLIGRLPQRVGMDGAVPVSFADGGARWAGWRSADQTPRFVAPAGGRLWTANNRILGTPEYLSLGVRYADLGARARQIRDGLQGLKAPVAEKDLFGLYHDDRAMFLERWQQLMRRVLEANSPDAGKPGANLWVEGLAAVRQWEARASTNSVSYRLVRAFRYNVMMRVMAPVLERCAAVSKQHVSLGERQETPVWALLESRPAHLLNPRFVSYDALLADAAQAVFADLERQGLKVSDASWGRRNVLRMSHPISRAVPALSRWLDLEPAPLAGDTHMTRVQGVGFGASERMVVSPGHEESGLFQMPGGQSGHFLSPFYRAGHEDWVRAQPSPLLPGPTLYRLDLEPR